MAKAVNQYEIPGRAEAAKVVGADTPEIIQGIGMVMVAGLTKAEFDDTVGVHAPATEEFVTMREKVLRGF